jgi:hypothetical protein
MADPQTDGPKTMSVSVPVLAAGTTTTVSTTNAINYCIEGKAFNKAALSNTATPTTDFATGAAFVGITKNQGTVVVLGLDSGATLRAAQGQVQALDAAGRFINAAMFPTIPGTMCPFGYIVLKAGNSLSGTWTFGSSNLSGVSGMTYTFVDIMTLPSRPQV